MGSLQGLSVLVTGGSRGLGLLLARQFARRGCDVTVAARDEEELDRAVVLLGGQATGMVTGRVCDVRDRTAVHDLTKRTAEAQGGLDVVMANAGVIQVGPAEATGVQGFRDSMETMFFGALHTSLEALPYLRSSPAGGRLGVIGSIGGLLSVPHLVPYSCAKSAVGALAEGLRAEEMQQGVSVTAIHPGLMRTGSHLQADFGGDAEREYSWFSTLAGLPLLTMNAARAAERIVSAVERRRGRLVLTPAAHLAATAHGLAPELVTRANSVVTRLLPDSSATSHETVKGNRIAHRRGAGRARWQKTLSHLNDRASERLNETGSAQRH